MLYRKPCSACTKLQFMLPVGSTQRRALRLCKSQWPYIWQFCILGSKQLEVILVHYAWSPHCFSPFLCMAHQSWSSDLRFLQGLHASWQGIHLGCRQNQCCPQHEPCQPCLSTAQRRGTQHTSLLSMEGKSRLSAAGNNQNWAGAIS